MMRLKPRSSERQGSTLFFKFMNHRWSLAILTIINFEQTSSNRQPCSSKSLLVFAGGKPTPLLLEGRGEYLKMFGSKPILSRKLFFKVISFKYCCAGESSPTLWQSLCPINQNKSLVNQHKSDAFSNQQNYGDKFSAI